MLYLWWDIATSVCCIMFPIVPCTVYLSGFLFYFRYWYNVAGFWHVGFRRLDAWSNPSYSVKIHCSTLHLCQLGHSLLWRGLLNGQFTSRSRERFSRSFTLKKWGPSKTAPSISGRECRPVWRFHKFSSVDTMRCVLRRLFLYSMITPPASLYSLSVLHGASSQLQGWYWN